MSTPLISSEQDEDEESGGEEKEDDLLLPNMTTAKKGIFDVKKSIYGLTFLSAVGGFLFGYDTGVVSGAMLLIEDDPDIHPDTFWKELIVSATVGAAWLFALVGGPCNEFFGRKPTILLARSVTFNYKQKP